MCWSSPGFVAGRRHERKWPPRPESGAGEALPICFRRDTCSNDYDVEFIVGQLQNFGARLGHNAENGFCVLKTKARGHRDLVTVVGQAATISAGEWITASGEWVNDRAHGQQFKARFLKTSAPTSIEGIEKYLGSGMIRGIGPA